MTGAPPPLVSFVVPVRDDAENLGRCLASIRAVAAGAPIEIIVVDNGSRDGSAAVARAAGATVLEAPGVPVAEARNRGAAAAGARLLAFVDADHVIDAGWVGCAVENLDAPGVGAAGAPYVAPGVTWVQRAYDRFRVRHPGPHPVDWLGSGNLAVRRDAFAAVGGFDRALETCEDVDFCNRLRSAGYTIVSDQRMRSLHAGDPSTLRALFLGELWRGRDNLRATLRGPLTARALPSVVIPVADVAFLATCAAGAAAAPWLGPLPALGGVAGFLSLSLARAWVLSRRSAGRAWRDLPSTFTVACVYDAARALALVARATHRVRREAGRP